MSYRLITEAPSWMLLICVFAGISYAWILYRNDRLFTDTNPWIVRFMAAFRFLAVTILSILLLSPLIRTVFKEIEKPIVVIIQDNSESVSAIRDSVNFLKTYPDEMSLLEENLKSDFDTRIFSIGNETKEQLQFTFDGKETDLSEPINELKARFAGRNLGAVILATDGLYNKGTNPIYAYSELKVPVYTIGLGDTTVLKDVLITRINHNKNVFAGNTFPVEVTIDARKCIGQTVTLTITKQNKELFTKQVAVTSNRFNTIVPVFLEAKDKGMNHYKATVTGVGDETSYENNTRDFFIDVTDNRQQVLIIANSPHPDLGAIKNLLELNPNFEVKLTFIGDFNGDFNGTNLVILHQLPSVSNNASAVLTAISKLELPVLYILGSQTGVTTFNGLETGVKISDHRGNFAELLPDPNRDFSLFTMDEELMRRISAFPPLISPFGTYELKSNAYVLLNQKVGSVKTGMPLMFFNINGTIKTGVIAGEGIWKWRMREFADFNNTEAVSALLLKTVQYLATREKKTPLRILYKNSYEENEPVIFDAESYNESGELINSGEVQITFTNEEGKSFPFTFSRTDKAFSLNAGYFPVGVYRFTASTKIGEKSYSVSGTVIIRSLQAELSETIANHQLLQALSAKTGGTFYDPGKLTTLFDELKRRNDIKPVSYSQKKLSEVINLKGIFALIMLLLSAEWFMRKRNGSY